MTSIPFLFGVMQATAGTHDASARLMQGAEAQYQLLNSVGANLTGPNADMYHSQAGIVQLAQQDKALALNRVQNNFMLNYWYAMLDFFQKRLDKDMQAKAKQ